MVGKLSFIKEYKVNKQPTINEFTSFIQEEAKKMGLETEHEGLCSLTIYKPRFSKFKLIQRFKIGIRGYLSHEGVVDKVLISSYNEGNSYAEILYNALASKF